MRQINYQLLMFRRVPIALFFTLLLPLIMLVLFNALFGDGEVTVDGKTWPTRQFYTGGLAAFTAVSATYTNLANMVPIRREEGVLKRWRGTPLPTWIYLAGMIVGCRRDRHLRGAVHARPRRRRLRPRSRCRQDAGGGRHVHRRRRGVRRARDGASPVSCRRRARRRRSPTPRSCRWRSSRTSSSRSRIRPAWLATIGDFFPLKPFASSFQDAFNPLVEAPGFDWGALARVAAWGIAGLVVALTTFRWEPTYGRPHPSPRRRVRRPSTCQTSVRRRRAQ